VGFVRLCAEFVSLKVRTHQEVVRMSILDFLEYEL